MVANFKKSLEVGKSAEQFAERFFKKHEIKYKDVRDNPEFQKMDIDYITDKLGNVEVKRNFHDAMYGKNGKYFWVELYVGENEGFWYKSKADNFIFFNVEGSGIIIKNDKKFRVIVTNMIENGDHSSNGNNRIDRVQDKRFSGDITVINMRCYLDDLIDAGINMTKIVNRGTK